MAELSKTKLQELAELEFYSEPSTSPWGAPVLFVIKEKTDLSECVSIIGIKNWTSPTTPTEIRQFLGLVGYYQRFIEGFSKIAKSLTELTHKNKKYIWDEDQESAFQLLKQKIFEAPILALPEENAICCLYVMQSPRSVAYKLELPEELSNIHSTFHISNLKKCLSDESLVIPMKELRLDDKLNFVEEPVEIMDREVKQLKQSRIPIVKVTTVVGTLHLGVVLGKSPLDPHSWVSLALGGANPLFEMLSVFGDDLLGNVARLEEPHMYCEWCNTPILTNIAAEANLGYYFMDQQT
ncbi:hypothetical protein Tco_1106183 [Tanacetum coccineum]